MQLNYFWFKRDKTYFKKVHSKSILSLPLIPKCAPCLNCTRTLTETLLSLNFMSCKLP